MGNLGSYLLLLFFVGLNWCEWGIVAMVVGMASNSFSMGAICPPRSPAYKRGGRTDAVQLEQLI